MTAIISTDGKDIDSENSEQYKEMTGSACTQKILAGNEVDNKTEVTSPDMIELAPKNNPQAEFVVMVTYPSTP